MFIFPNFAPFALAQTEALAVLESAPEALIDGQTNLAPTPTVGEAPNSETDQIAISDAVDEKVVLDEKSLAPEMSALTAGDDGDPNYGEERKPYESKLNARADEATGAFVYSYPIEVPPGRNGLQPDLQLTYNNQDANLQNWFGYGWSMNIPYIERQNKKGVEKMYQENDFYSSLSGELKSISLSDGHHGRYGAKIEGDFAMFSYEADNSWEMKDKNGTSYIFGLTANSRQDDIASTSRVFRWMLEEIRDTNNNFIKYEYYKDSGQIYPSKIKYSGFDATDGIFEVEFLRELRNDQDKSYKNNFLIKNNYRINEIKIKSIGNIIKKFALSFISGGNGTRSLLDNIVMTGYDEISGGLVFPATQFDYQIKENAWEEDVACSLPRLFENNNFAAFGDVNGDGVDDIIHSTYLGDNYTQFNVYLGNGFCYEQSTVWSKYYYSVVPFPGKDNSARLVDVNGDGRADIISQDAVWDTVAHKYHFRVYINDGDSFELDTNYSVPDIDVGDLSKNTIFGDVNGDGLIDIAYSVRDSGGSNYYSKYVCLNAGNGSGWGCTENQWIMSGSNEYMLSGSKNTKMFDVNSDGLADIIDRGDPYAYNLYAYINNGGSFVKDQTISIPQLDDGNGRYFASLLGDVNGDSYVDIIQSENYDGYNSNFVYYGKGSGWNNGFEFGSGGTTYPFVENKSFLVDSNGDGVNEIISFYSNNNSYRVFNGKPERPDLLSGITKSSGLKVDVNYKHLVQSTDSKAPYNFPVVNKIIINDGLSQIATTSYEYFGGDYYFNNYTDKRFAGFSKIKTTDPEGNVIINYFHQGNTSSSTLGEWQDDQSKIGRIYRTEKYDNAGNLFSQKVNKWENIDLGNDRDFVYLSQSIDYAFDGNSTHKDKSSSFTYDSTNGNLVQKIEYGEVTGANDGTFTDAGTDRASTTIQYAASTTQNLYLSSKQWTEDQNNNKVSESKYYYDNLSLGQVGKGNMTKQENWVEASTYIDTEKTYNAYGLVTQEKDPRDKITTYAYDQYNLYPASVTNAKNQTTQFLYDYSSGQVKSTTDPNNLTHETVFDALDRPLEERQPGFDPPYPLVIGKKYTYNDTAAPRWIKEERYLDSSNIVESYTYLDGFDRPIQTRQEAESANVFSIKDMAYDKRGFLQKESLPYFGSGSATTQATSAGSLFINYAYDPLGRVKTIVNAIGTTTNAYDDWKTTSLDPEDKQKSFYSDARGNLVQVDEKNGSSTYSTAYQYNLLGNLTKIIDALNNVRNFTYDALGRQNKAEDLHAAADTGFGSTTFAYDPSGNLTQKIDAKGQIVNYTYDDLNRVLTEDYAGQTGIEVANTYDNCDNGIGIGQLCSTDTTAGVFTSWLYNSLGLKQFEGRWLDSIGQWQEQWTDYDRQGNPVRLYYPDNSEVWYGYNSAGLLEMVEKKEVSESSYSDLLWNIDYNPQGQKTREDFANGVITNYSYDPAKLYRLASKTTSAKKVEVQNPVISDILFNASSNSGVKTSTTTLSWDHTVSTASSGPILVVGTQVRDSVDADRPVVSVKYNGVNLTKVRSDNDNVNDISSELWYLVNPILNTSAKIVVTFTGAVDNLVAGAASFSGVSTSSPIDAQNGICQVTSPTLLSVPITTQTDKAVIIDSIYTRSDQTFIATNGAVQLYSLGPRNNDDRAGMSYKKISTAGATSTAWYWTSSWPQDQWCLSVAALKPIVTGGSVSTSTILAQNLSYAYDKAGNITRIVDNSETNAKKTMDYAYDDLYRLTRASSTNAINGQNYLETYSYSAIGNILNKSDVGAYAYASTGFANPHAATAINGITQTYDNNGNLTSDSQWTHSWDYRNRLTQSSKGTTTIKYAYDQNDQRIMYAVDGKATTTTVNKYYETSGGTSTKNIYANDQLIATIETANGSSSGSSTAPAFIQGAITISNNQLNFPGAVTAGNLIVVGITKYNAAIPSNAISDNKGNAYVKVAEAISGSDHAAIFYAKNVIGGSSFTVSSSVSGGTLSIHEYSGIDQSSPLDKFSSSTGASITPNSGNITTTIDNELYFGLAWSEGSGNFTPGSGYTFRYQETDNAVYERHATEDKIGNAQTTAATFGINSSWPWAAVIATFKPLASGEGSTASSGQTFYVHTDHLSGSNVVTNNLGGVVQLLDYYPYGGIRLDERSGNIDEKRKFTGHEYDDSTGLYYMVARFQNPSIGRFISQDSLTNDLGIDYDLFKKKYGKDVKEVLSDPQGLNSYSYVKNNPIRYTDPTGKYGEDVHLDLTYYLARMSGLSIRQSVGVSSADQSVDTNLGTAPTYGENVLNGTTNSYHFGSRLDALVGMKGLLNSGSSDNDSMVSQYGAMLHTFQDTYSHGGLNMFSHAWKNAMGNSPDLTYQDPAKAMEMAKATFSLLRRLNATSNGTGGLSLNNYNAETQRLWNEISKGVQTYLNSQDKSKTDIKKQVNTVK